MARSPQVRMLARIELGIAIAIALLAASSASALEIQERIVAGDVESPVAVRHLVLRGSNAEIGAHLATLARDRHQVKMVAIPAAERLKPRLLARYHAERFPIHHARMLGVAGVFGLELDLGEIDPRGLFYNLSGELLPGCSVTYYPPATTAGGAGILSRNYDFTTGTLDGRSVPSGRLGATGRPYVLELHPDQGHASLAIVAYDLVGGVLDGINAEGLSVALLADDESAARYPRPEGPPAFEVGLYELNVPRFLLDNCADCDEAASLLLMSKRYVSYIPAHYLVADRHGRSFVFETSIPDGRDHLIEGEETPQVITNHPLHRYGKGTELPAGAPESSYGRYRELCARTAAGTGPHTIESIKAAHAAVAVRGPGPQASGMAAHRTLWHALYFLDERRLSVDFYLGEAPAAAGKTGGAPSRRSGYLEFELAP
jgi:Acyl-coenzyme A:6-aminopenicillanic acid acyl-transferase